MNICVFGWFGVVNALPIPTARNGQYKQFR